MKIGAQLYSLRKQMETPEDIRAGFNRLKAMGYENVQVSGIGAIDPHELKDVSETSGLPIVCTHIPYKRIIEETDKVIEEHKIYGCDVIGLGAMDKSFRDSEEGLNAFLASMEKPVAKILDAGLHFAYHNHAFEFSGKTQDGMFYYDKMLERCPDWQFILDVYWVAYAYQNPEEYIRKVGTKRLPNIHFKDMALTEDRTYCPCGKGRMNFARLAELCKEYGVKNVLVEQDNCTSSPDPFGDMEFSLRTLQKIIK